MAAEGAFSFQTFDELPSTSAYVKELPLEELHEGLVVRARRQSGGYGRQGKTWESPAGGLYFTVVLKPRVRVAALPSLSLFTALSLCHTMYRLAGIGGKEPAQASAVLRIKWPNDVMLVRKDGSFGKLAGILLEKHHDLIFLGVGINVFSKSGAMPGPSFQEGAKYQPAFLQELFGAEDADALGAQDTEERLDFLMKAFLHDFWLRYPLWQQKGFALFTQEYQGQDFLFERRVCLVDERGNTLATGAAMGVNESGALVVRTSEGARPFFSGEVRFCR